LFPAHAPEPRSTRLMQEQLSFSKFEKPVRFIVGAGLPAKQATRRLAPAPPVFAGRSFGRCISGGAEPQICAHHPPM